MGQAFIDSLKAARFARDKYAVGPAPSPKAISGTRVAPNWGFGGGGFAYSANDLVYVPIWIANIQTWAGLGCRNSGTGDNTDRLRMAIYEEKTGLTGGPGELLKDCGEITLDGTVTARTALSTFTNRYVGWHYVALHMRDALSLNYILTTNIDSSVGRYPINGFSRALPSFTTDSYGTWSGTDNYGLLVNTAYAAFATTAVAPTTAALAPEIRLIG